MNKPDIENFTIDEADNHIKELYVAINVQRLILHTTTEMEDGIKGACVLIEIYKELDETYQQLTKLLKTITKENRHEKNQIPI